MWGRRQSPEPPRRSLGSARLDALVRAQMPDADADLVRLVVSVTGLLATVAYADRRYTDAERAHVREALERIHGLGTGGVEAICDTLREHIVELASSNTQAFTRDLCELGDVALRREVLDALLDCAAADEELSLAETSLLRRTARALNLDDADYLAAQSRHRERLSVLK